MRIFELARECDRKKVNTEITQEKPHQNKWTERRCLLLVDSFDMFSLSSVLMFGKCKQFRYHHKAFLFAFHHFYFHLLFALFWKNGNIPRNLKEHSNNNL